MIMELRNIEDMLQTPEMRQQAAVIRERMRQIMQNKKRFSKKPHAEEINDKLYTPILQLKDKVKEELARLNDTKNKIRVDRDPVRAKYQKQVRTYFERLGRGDK